jgi:hypothetical protein
MLAKIASALMMGIPASLMTYTTAVWWHSFGVHEVYPYLGTLLCILLWLGVYLTIKEKED